MAKINRYNGDLPAFADQAQGTERTVFGSTTQDDTLDANITADFQRGWGIVGVNENPSKQDFNGLAYTLSQLLAYLHQMGVPEWNASQEYPDGAITLTASGLYKLVPGGDGSVDPDVDDGTNWGGTITKASLVSMEGGTSVEVAVNQKVTMVGDVANGFYQRVGTDLHQYSVIAWHPGGAVMTNPLGGGMFVYDASRPKSDHNGGTVISPTVPSLSLQSSVGDFLSGVGETDGAGSGCFVRLEPAIDLIESVDFGAKPETGFDNYSSFQAAIDYAVSSGIKGVRVGQGEFEYGTTLTLTTTGITFVGVENAATITGGTARNCLLVWTGGASPMKQCDTSANVFEGFAVENRGTATDWLELNSGAINNRYKDLYFVDTATHTYFSRSVIRSNGNRMGYSHFDHIIANSPAPKFIDIDGQGTSGGITPFSISGRSIFGANTADFVVIDINDETVEHIDIYDCTFNQFGYVLEVVNTLGTPGQTAINVLNFHDNELDTIGDDAAYRYFRLQNVDNFLFDANTINAGGSKTYLATLSAVNVASCEGNSCKSLGTAFFDATDNCIIKGGANATGGRPIADNRNAMLEQQAQGPSIVIDATTFDVNKHEIVEVDLTSGSGYTLNIDTSLPQFINIGQVFTLVVRNVSGGAVAAGAFGATFAETAAPVAPANGNSRSYTFYWNGTVAVEISRNQGDAPNS